MYHQMSLGPDRWSKSWVKPIFWPDAVVGPCGSPGNIDMVSYSSRGDALSRLYNCKRLVQYSGSKTLVFYSRKSTRSYCFGKYKMQPLPPSMEGYQDYALLYPSQKDNLYKLFLQKSPGYMMDTEEFCMKLEGMVAALNT